ncbi:Phosphatase yieH [Verticillium dahliae VDG2]|nr:Phosphatase yieH [Verticillium dahliae VDG2]
MVAPNVLITILPGEYSLIHFPPMLYTHFLHPVLQALLPQSQTISPDDARETPPWPQHSLPGLTEDHQHNFLNVSVTPLEASVVCHADWARTVFRPAIDRILETLPSHVRKPAVLSPDTYLVLSVISGGGGGSDTDIVARILDLTAPLALAGIPIFFISTYYSDFILVPAKDRATVLAALTARGFHLTLAVDDPPSLLLDRALVPLFGDTLVGSADEELVALSLDLAGLPLEATGIVCGARRAVEILEPLLR